MRSSLLAGAVALAACHTPPETTTMPVHDLDANKHAVRRLFEDGFNRERADAIAEVVGDAYVNAAGERGPAAFQQVIARLRGAFPDIHYTLDAVVAEGDEVAVRWRWTGTHRGPFRGVAPTQRTITNTGAAIFRMRGGQIVASELETDRLGFLQGIGVVAPDDALFPPAAR